MCNRVSDDLVKSQERIAMWKEFTIPQLVERLYQCAPTFATLEGIVQTFVQKEDGYYNSLTGRNGILVRREDVGYMLVALRHKTNGGDEMTDNNTVNIKALRELREQKLLNQLSKLTKSDFEAIFDHFNSSTDIQITYSEIVFFRSDVEALQLYYSNRWLTSEEKPGRFDKLPTPALTTLIGMLEDTYFHVTEIDNHRVDVSKTDLPELRKELKRRKQK